MTPIRYGRPVKRPKKSNRSSDVFIKQARLCISVQFSRHILSFYNERGLSCPRRGNCTLIFRLVSTVFHLLSTPTLTPSVDSWAPAACLSSLHYLFFLYNINIQLLLFVFWLLPIPLLTRVFKKVVHKVLDLASSFCENRWEKKKLKKPEVKLAL